MNNLIKAFLTTVVLSITSVANSSPDDDVTIRMMRADEHDSYAVTRHIELPEAASDNAREHAAKGMDTANTQHKRKKHDDDKHLDRDRDRDHEIEREHDEIDRDDRKDIDNDGVDREESEHEESEHEGDD